LHNEVPGIQIPDRIRTALFNAGEGAAGLGVKLSCDFLKEAKSCVAGAYMMPPFRKYHIIDELLGVI
jgi:homocysteine S-methyltransferase